MNRPPVDGDFEQNVIILRAPALGAMRNANAGPGATAAAEAAAEAAAGVTVEIDGHLNRDTVHMIVNDPTVLGFAPAMPMKLIEPFEAPESTPQEGTATWGVSAVRAVDSPFTGNGITVAVLDTGIDASHPAFAGVNLIQKDFTGAGSAADDNGHGTHCAGTIFGRDVDGLRIGVAPGVTRSLIGKVLGGPSGGGSDSLCQAIVWALDNGANVISMSLGIDFPGWVEKLVERHGLSIPVATSIALEQYRANVRLFEQLTDLLNAKAAFAQTTLVVAAAGNESGRNQDPPFEINVAPPAASTGVVAVAALGQSAAGLQVASFSNTRATVAAPGVGVISAVPGGGLRSLSGTSMAAPHVAGVAALWAQRLAQQGALSPVMLQAKLIGQAVFDGVATDTDPLDIGSGLVQAPM